MNLLITGGTGFIGSALCEKLLAENHQVTLLTRDPIKINKPVKVVTNLAELTENETVDVVINLAGEPIADKRWSEQQKLLMTNSRLHITEQLISYLERLTHKPSLFISGSAIGFYGTNSHAKLNSTSFNTIVDESSGGDNSFSSQLCQQWEAVALKAQALNIRTCLLRTGIVLGKNGGALGKMLLPFKLGLGGKIGHGKQWMPWIHLDDLIGIILYCIHQPSLHGAINGTAPNPVINQNFTKALGRTLKRPTFFPMPAMVVKVLMGQMGEELLLSGKKVVPKKILKAGYNFKYKTLEEALKNIV